MFFITLGVPVAPLDRPWGVLMIPQNIGTAQNIGTENVASDFGICEGNDCYGTGVAPSGFSSFSSPC